MLLGVAAWAHGQQDPLAFFDGTWVSVNPPGPRVIFSKVGLSQREASLPIIGPASIRVSDGQDGSDLKVSGPGFDCYYGFTKINAKETVWDLKSGSPVCLKSAYFKKVEDEADNKGSSEAIEAARICREVEGMSNLATLSVLQQQHAGRPAGQCIAARIAQLTRPPPPPPPRPVITPPPAACGWYAIAYCARDAGEARAYTGTYAGYVINTSDYPRFRAGWFCVVQGPMGRDAAAAVVDRMKARGAATAYIKNSC